MTRKCLICGETVEHVDEVERHLQVHSWAERETALMPVVDDASDEMLNGGERVSKGRKRSK